MTDRDAADRQPRETTPFERALHVLADDLVRRVEGRAVVVRGYDPDADTSFAAFVPVTPGAAAFELRWTPGDAAILVDDERFDLGGDYTVVATATAWTAAIVSGQLVARRADGGVEFGVPGGFRWRHNWRRPLPWRPRPDETRWAAYGEPPASP